MGEYIAEVKNIFDYLDQKPPGQYPAGYKDYDKAILRYATEPSNNPNLTIISPIFDSERNVIQPGYYGLILSDDRKMLLLVQRGKIIAVIPVFKLEVDKSQEQTAQPMDNRSQRKFDREQKKKQKKREKLIKEGKMSDEPEIYMDASIQYNNEEGYYLIKYERDKIRAWGAIK